MAFYALGEIYESVGATNEGSFMSPPPHPPPPVEVYGDGLSGARCVALRFLFFLKGSENNLQRWSAQVCAPALTLASPRCHLTPRPPSPRAPLSVIKVTIYSPPPRLSKTVIKAPPNEGLSRKEDSGEGKIRRDG